MADVAVVGAGLVGLLTGILLARRGHQVVVVDSDEDPPDGSVEEDFHWPQPGVPQGWHGHVWRPALPGFCMRTPRTSWTLWRLRGSVPPGSSSARDMRTTVR